MLLAVALLLAYGGGESQAESRRRGRYPNELPGFKLYAQGKWKALRPYVSTKADVDRLLGEPSPVLIPYDSDWQVIVHYFESSSTNGRPWGAAFKGTVDSLSFHPRRRVSFKGVVFPRAFKCGGIHFSHAPAPLMECSDGTGLAYQIYTGDSDDGDIREGDLREIVYGASAKVLKKIEAGGRADPKHNNGMHPTPFQHASHVRCAGARVMPSVRLLTEMSG